MLINIHQLTASEEKEAHMEKLRYVGGNKMCAASVRMSNNIHLKLIGLVMGLLHFSIMASADLPSLEDRIHENGMSLLSCDCFQNQYADDFCMQTYSTPNTWK